MEEFKKIEKEVNEDKELNQQHAWNLTEFSEMSLEELEEILSLTIKADKENKLLTFLGQLSVYTPDSQLNISFSAPSSTGKSYIPLEIAKFFNKEDVMSIGYCSPTSFFHEYTDFDKEKNEYIVNLEKKIVIFLDQPHSLLLQYLRPLLSHDEKEIRVKITDRTKRTSLRTKSIILRGFPSVIFCSASSRFDEQEVTRFLLLSPEISQAKIKAAVDEKIRKELDFSEYEKSLTGNNERAKLKERISFIKTANIKQILVDDGGKIAEFLSKQDFMKPRHTRDIGKIISLAKTLALLNLWQRKTEEEGVIKAIPEDFGKALDLWGSIADSQQLNLPPYLLDVYNKVFIPLWDKLEGLSMSEITRQYYKTYGCVISPKKLKSEILPMLESAGLIIEEPDPIDKRRVLWKKPS